MAGITVKDKDGNVTISEVIMDGSGIIENNDGHKRSKKEKFYDKKIAPELGKLAKICHKKGMAFLAVVEYQKDCVGRTSFQTKKMAFEFVMTYLAMKSSGNIDRFIRSFERYCRENNIGTSNSIYLNAINEYYKQFSGDK